jgi:hypothetical protein
MTLSNRYSGMERRDLLLTELQFHISSKENSFRKLLRKVEGDPTVRSKVITLWNRYSGLERGALHLTD